VDERHVVVAEEAEPDGRGPTHGQVKARAFVLDVETGQARSLGGEAQALALPGSRVHFATAGGRFLLFATSVGSAGPDIVSGLSVDVTSGQSTTIVAG
jgi:hypothetical protein